MSESDFTPDSLGDEDESFVPDPLREEGDGASHDGLGDGVVTRSRDKSMQKTLAVRDESMQEALAVKTESVQTLEPSFFASHRESKCSRCK